MKKNVDRESKFKTVKEGSKKEKGKRKKEKEKRKKISYKI